MNTTSFLEDGRKDNAEQKSQIMNEREQSTVRSAELCIGNTALAPIALQRLSIVYALLS